MEIKIVRAQKQNEIIFRKIVCSIDQQNEYKSNFESFSVIQQEKTRLTAQKKTDSF